MKDSPSKLDECLQKTEELLDYLEKPSPKASIVLGKVMRLSQLRGDTEMYVWAKNELYGYSGGIQEVRKSSPSRRFISKNNQPSFLIMGVEALEKIIDRSSQSTIFSIENGIYDVNDNPCKVSVFHESIDLFVSSILRTCHNYVLTQYTELTPY